MLLNYIKIAFRRLVREKQYVVTNIIGLTVGITACILIGLFVHHELSYDRYHENSDRIYRVLEERPRSGEYETYTWSFDKNFSEEVPDGVQEVEESVSLTLSHSFDYLKHDDVQYRELNILASQSSLFDVFTHTLIYGSKEGILDRPNTIALSEETAQRIFGEGDPVGRTITVMHEGRVVEEIEMEVTGVFQNVPTNSHFTFDAAISFGSLDPEALYMLSHYLTLKPESSPDLVEGIIDEASTAMHGNDPIHYQLQPLTDIYLGDYNALKQGDINKIYLFSAIAILILVIAIMNYINLSTARGGLRAKEVGIRKVSGASRGALIRQFMGEAVVYAFLVIPLALLLVELLMPHFNRLMDLQFNLSLLENVSMATVLMLLVAGAGMIAGIYPSLVLSSFQPADVLKGSYSGTAGGSGFRKGLIISCGLILSTLVVIQQMNYMQIKDLGYATDRVVEVRLGNPSNRPNSELIMNEFLNNPHVEEASLSAGGLTSLGGMFANADRQDSTEITANLTYSFINPDFIPMMGIQIMAGHNYREEVTEDLESGVIINESAVSLLGWEDPQNAVGGRVQVNDRTVRTIIGVTEDFHIRSLHEPLEPLAMFARSGNMSYYSTLQVRIRPDRIQESLTSLEETWKNVVPGIAFNYEFLDEKLGQLYEQEQRTNALFTAFAMLAIILACLGLFGLATYASHRRTREIGIRKVLGAGISRILVLLSKDFTLLVLAGFIVSVPIAWHFMQQWLQQFAYRVEIGMGTILVSGLITLAIAVLTVSWKSLTAATANPVDSLRSE